MKKLFITATLLLLLFLKPLFAGVDKGIDVTEVQRMLTELCFKPGPVDGAWGKKTETAFKEFYKPYGKYDGTFDNFELRVLKGIHFSTSKNKQCKIITVKEAPHKPLTISDKLAQRKTINPFLAWNPKKPQSKYGLAWAKYINSSNKTITLNEVYWAYHYLGNLWHYYPGIQEYLTNRDWDHATEYGKILATQIIDPNFHTFIINVMKDKIKKDGSDGIMLDWWHNHHQSSSGYSKQQVGNARRAIAKKLREALGPEGIILGNVSWVKDQKTTEYINGVFLELSKSPDPSSHRLYNSKELRDMENLIVYYEKNLQFPKLIALEGWRKTTANTAEDRNSPENRKMAKLLTAMSVVIPTNGYILYADNNNDTPDGDHEHTYYDFYSFDIGKPTSGYEKLANGVGIKQHQKGFIAYNRNSRPHTLKLDNNVNLVIEGTSGLFCKKKSSGYDCLPPD